MAQTQKMIECCESHEVHKDLLKIVNEKLPSETELYDLAELFKVFGDSTRIRILFVLFEAEVCVCDLAEALGMTQSAISHQLRILKQNKLVKARRDGKSIFYSHFVLRHKGSSRVERRVIKEGTMDKRISVISIIVYERDQAAKVNAVLHEYADYIIGRMGLPYEKKGVSIISVVMDAPMSCTSALSGKLGMIDGVTAKCNTAKI